MSSRPSMYPGASLASTGSSTGSTAAMQRLSAKQAELEGLRVLKEQTARLTKDIEKLGDTVDSLVVGGDSFASVMASWQGVFRAIQISRERMANLALETAAVVSSDPTAPPQVSTANLDALPDDRVNVGTLVRIPVDSDAVGVQQAASAPDGDTEA